MKKLLTLLFTIISVAVFAQSGSLKQSGYFTRVTDTTTYQSAAAVAHSQGYVDIYWNEQATTPHLDIWDGASAYRHVFEFGGAGGSGTVTSVAMTVPSFLSVSGSPVTAAGTFAVSLSGTALPATSGGTGLTALGSANRLLGMNNAGTALEYKTISTSTTAVSNDVGVTLTGANATVINIPTASQTVRGVVSTAAQEFAGTKTFANGVNISGLSSGAVLFAGASSNITQDQLKFKWDASNDQLMVGTNTAVTNAKITTSESTSGLGFGVHHKNTSNGSGSAGVNRTSNDGNLFLDMRVNSSTFTGAGNANRALIVTDGSSLTVTTNDTSPILIRNAFGTTPKELTAFTNTGVGIFGVTSPTASLHLPAGTATASTAPLKFTTGTALSAIENGALEYHSDHLYFSTSSTRYQLDRQNPTLDVDASDVGNVGAGEDQLYSYTLPANTLAVNEQRIIVRVAMSLAANGNNKRVKVKFGSTNIIDPGIGGISGTVSAECEITRTGAATQKCNCTVIALTGTHAVLSDMTETLSGGVAIVVTGEAVDDNDIIKESVSVELKP